GVDLVRRVEGAAVHALATPLLTKSDGSKYGKTAEGTLWLDPGMSSPFAFYQYFLNQADADVGGLLRVFSFSHEEIEELERSAKERPEERAAQLALAGELTALVYGDEAVEEAVAASRALFGEGDLAGLDARTMEAAVAEVPRTTVEPGEELRPLIDLAVASGLFESRGSAKQAIAQGGLYVNNRRVADGAASLTRGDLLHGRWLLLRRGKRTLAAVEVR
ncbi:MAG: tyrosine--tRNA ligase, partial [Chloroflexi bacterium]